MGKFGSIGEFLAMHIGRAERLKHSCRGGGMENYSLKTEKIPFKNGIKNQIICGALKKAPYTMLRHETQYLSALRRCGLSRY